MSKPTNFDIPQSLETVWDALHCYREDCIPESDSTYDEQWSDLTTAMAWITEALGYDISTADDDTNGEYVLREDEEPVGEPVTDDHGNPIGRLMPPVRDWPYARSIEDGWVRDHNGTGLYYVRRNI